MAQPLPPPDEDPAPASPERIVAYTWEPVTRAADRLVCAIVVDRRNYDVLQVANQLRAMPPGHRAIRLWKWAAPDLTRHVADRCRRPDGRPTEYWYPQPTAGVNLVRARWRIFLAQLHAAGAPLDEVIVDFEGGYDMWAGMAGGDKAAHLSAIENDARYNGVHSTEAGDLDSLDRVLDYRHHEDYLVWNAAMRRVVDAALEASIYEPLRELYPNARCSNFGSMRIKRKHVVPTVMGASPQWYESDGFGTHEGAVAYGTISPYTASRIMRDGEPLGMSPYAAFLFAIKRIEAVQASTTRPIKVWVLNRNRSAPRPRPVQGTPYNDEILRHMLVRRYGLLIWNHEMGRDVQEMMQTNAVIEDVAGQIGETGDALPSQTEWVDTIVHSATSGPDRVVHRFTLEFPDQPIRYRINGVEYLGIPGDGEVGLWVTHAPGDDFHVVE
jgi:hypothetical protein